MHPCIHWALETLLLSHDLRFCLLFLVTFGDCSSSSCLTSVDHFKDEVLHNSTPMRDSAMHLFFPLISKCVFVPSNWSKQKQWVSCGWDAQAPQLCVIDLVSLKARRIQRTWKWIAACSPTGVLITLCRYCSEPPDKLKGLKQTPLIKTSAYRCDSTLFPVYGSDWFCSQVTQRARAHSICFLAARATLSSKMALQTQVASTPMSAFPNAWQSIYFWGSWLVVPLVLLEARSHLLYGTKECVH